MHFIHVKTLRKIQKFKVFNRSNVYLDWSKKLKNSHQTIYLARLYSIATRSIEKEHLIDRLVIEYQLNQIDWSLFHSIDQKQFSIDQNLWNSNFLEFFWSSFQRFFMNKQPSYEHNRLSLRSKLNSIDAIALKFNLTYLISNLNNINISFYQTVISTTM